MKSFKEYISEMPALYTSGIYSGRVGDEFDLNAHARHGNAVRLTSLKNYNINSTGPDVKNETIFAQHKKTGKVHMHIDFAGGHVVGLHAHKDSEVKAHEVYHHLITNYGMDIKSDTNQSPGAMKVWKKLKSYPDIKITHHKDDFKSGKRIKMKNKFEDNYGSQNRDTYFKAVKK